MHRDHLAGNQYFVPLPVFFYPVPVCRPHLVRSPRFIPLSVFYTQSVVRRRQWSTMLNGQKSQPKFFNVGVVFNPYQSSPSLTIVLPLIVIIISLVFFFLCKALFSGFLQFNGNFVDGQNNSKYRDSAPLTTVRKKQEQQL